MKHLFDKLLIAVLAGGLALLAEAAAPTMFIDSLELKVGNVKEAANPADQATFENLPVFVKVFESKEKFPGFMISRSGGLDGNGTDIRFSQDGKILPHEMVAAEQDDNGKYVSFSFWVKVPRVTAGSRITMHWGVKDNERPPINRPKEVWSDYVGVWHKAARSDKTVSDASGNGHTLTRDASGNLMFPCEYLKLLGSDKSFTLTGYYVGDGVESFADGNKNVIFGTWNRLGNANGRGWGADAWMKTRMVFRASAGGDDYSQYNIGSGNYLLENETHLAYVAEGITNYWGYVNGNKAGHSNGFTINHDGEEPLRIAHSDWSAREVRLAKVARSSAWIEEEIAAQSETYVVMDPEKGHVVATYKNEKGEDVLENYWISEPKLSTPAWSDPKKVVFDPGEALYGDLEWWIEDATSGTDNTYRDFESITDKTNENYRGCGAYRVVIRSVSTNPPSKQLEKIIYFAYVGKVTSQDLGDNRRMLFNDLEGNTPAQGAPYWSNPTVTETNNEDSVEPIVRTATEHLDHQSGWKIRYGKIGNAREEDRDSNGQIKEALDGNKNYLPFGPGALDYQDPTKKATSLINAGAAILFNYSDHTDPAAVYSPVFTDGVGEIYFDAVNMDTDYRNRLELQYLTGEAATSASPDWASDHQTASNLEILVVKEGEKANTWTGRSFVPLMMSQNGETANTRSLYRVRAKLNISGPVIFRIARTDTSWGAGGLEGPGKILVDNIHVSEPTTEVELHRLEETWDSTRDFGKNLLGDRGTLSKPFPEVGEKELYARVRVTYKGFGSTLSDRDKNVAALIFKYRLRYLNSSVPGNDGSEKSIPMSLESDGPEGSIFKTDSPLNLGNQPCDVEYSFEYTPNPTSYDYVDYYGLPNARFEAAVSGDATTLPFKGDYDRTPALGHDFFFRLREGYSDYEQLEMIWRLGSGDIIVTNRLHLAEDHLWTGAIAVANEDATFSFKLRGVNYQAKGENFFWEMENEGEVAKDSPYSAIAELRSQEPDFKVIAAEVVKNTRQFIVRFDDSTGAFSLCRGDYQDFNSWTDAAANAKGEFVAHSGQNGADPIASTVLQKRFPADTAKNVFEDWTANVETEDLWRESFTTGYGDVQAALTDVLQGTDEGAKTLNGGWLGHNFMYVNESLNNLFSESYESRAALLVGGGSGSLESDASEDLLPDGIGEVRFRARLGQQHTYDRVSTYIPRRDYNFTPYDYLVSARVAMSTTATSASDLGFDGQGTVSIFAYHSDKGSYEFRMKRLSRNQIELGLYRWYQEQGSSTMKIKELHRVVRNANGLESDRNSGRTPGTVLCSDKLDNGNENTTAYVAFLSVKSILDDHGNVVKNQLYAGFTNNNGVGSAYSNRPSVATEIADHEMTWHSIYVQDSTFKDSKNRDITPIEQGTFGFLSTDCPARFMRPTIHPALDKVVSGKNQAYSDKITLPAALHDTTKGGTVDATTFWNHWYVAPSSAMGKWSVIGSDNKYRDYYGIVTPEVSQKLIVSSRPVGSSASAWSVLETKEISSFNYSDVSISAHSAEKSHIKLATGVMKDEAGDELPRCDVILDDIEMTQWHAGTTANLYQHNDDFVFTGVWVEGEGADKKAEFWPLRVSTKEYETVRAPLLKDGIGAISFSYDLETLDPNAELVIEYIEDADNKPLNSDYVYSYTNDRDYNSKDIGDKYWKVYKSFKYEDLYAAGGHIIEYIGKRAKFKYDEKTREGGSLLRLRVPQDVIIAAHEQNDGEYGRIDLKSIVVWDEPSVDERAWTAWNVRVANAKTAEEEYGAYDKLLNIDSWLDVGGTSGMSMELNNGADGSAEPQLVTAHRPYIQSPALTTPDGEDSGVTIGEINFRARKSGTDDAYVGVYAVTDFSSDESKNDESKMSLIETVKLDSTVWQNFTIKNTASNVKAVRLVMMNEDEAGNKSGRALFDELSVTERVDPNVVVTFARPFRNNLNNTDAIPDAVLASPDEQPLCDEEWGIQCTLALKELEKVIKPESIRVYCEYYAEYFTDARYKWGYDKWAGESAVEGKRGTIELALATNTGDDSSRLVYRMTQDTGYIQPIRDANTVVQYSFRVTFETNQDTDEHVATPFNPADSKQWTTPEWYYPVDFNKSYPGSAAYTILDKVAPKRAWINEVNVWDGTLSKYDEELTNQWVELAIPAGVDLTDWSLEAVSANNESGIKTYKIMTFGDTANGCNASKSSSEPFAFYIAAHPESKLKGVADGLLKIPSRYAGGGVEGIFREGANDGGGYFSASVPFALRLVRPTGVVDHEVLVAGYKLTDKVYNDAYARLAPSTDDTGHNKVLAVGSDDGAAITEEGKSVTLSMTNVAKVSDLTISDRWLNTLVATPGEVNVDQKIDDNYLIEPNDNTVTISLTVEGNGIEQDVGTGTGYTVTRLRTTFTKGSTTPIVVKYRLAPWYEIGEILVLVNDTPVEHDGVLKSLGGGEYEFTYLPTERCEIRAVSRNNSSLMALIGENNAYEDAILKWMREKYPDLDPDDICLTEVWCSNPPANGVEGKKLSLTEMYWIGADPSEPNWALSFYADSPHPDVEEGYDVVKVPIHVLLVNYAEGDRTDIRATKQIETIASKVYGVDSAAYYKNRNNADYPINDWSSNGPTLQIIGCMPKDWTTSWGQDLSKNFYPIMHYIINEKSFEANGEREIVLPDPFGPYSVTGRYHGWDYYKSEEYKATGGKLPDVWYKLKLGERKSDEGYLLDMLR